MKVITHIKIYYFQVKERIINNQMKVSQMTAYLETNFGGLLNTLHFQISTWWKKITKISLNYTISVGQILSRIPFSLNIYFVFPPVFVYSI